MSTTKVSVRKMSPRPIVQRSNVKEMREHALPLLRRHAEEVLGPGSGDHINPAWDRYEALESRGILRAFAAWCDGKVVGYVVTMVFPDLHQSLDMIATCDVFYVLPEYRGRGVADLLLKEAEDDAKIAQAVKVNMHAAVDSRAELFLRRKGYAPKEIQLQKVL